MNVRVRGIYATALTRRLRDRGHQVVQASPPIRRRFDAEFPVEPADVAVETTADRQGVIASGVPEAVDTLREDLVDVAVDALAWSDPVPLGAVFDAEVTDELRGGAVVDLGEREGYLPYGNVDAHVEAGDAVRVQVHEPAARWTGDRPVVGETRRAPAGLATLRDDFDGTRVDAPEDEAQEVAGMTDLLDLEVPPSWGVEWSRAAVDADLDAMAAALERAVDRATDLIGLPDEVVPTRRLAAPAATSWVWFGRDSRFALDAARRGVTDTMPGHHRVKAGGDGASDAVDFVEAVCDGIPAGRAVADDDAGGRAVEDGDAAAEPGEGFPFEAVTGQFGPREGDRVAIEHGKPDGRLLTLGRGEVLDVEADGSVTVRREVHSRGTYDALETAREPGDTATTRLKEGRWWYPTKYVGEGGRDKGTYVNVCTPVEVFPDAVRYVDLHVDVVSYPDGTVERVDDDELDAAVEAGNVTPALAERTRAVASRLVDGLAD